MAQWTRRGRPVRFAVRAPDGLLHGFAERDEAREYAEEVGSEVVEVVEEMP
jgi:hypothetical protein